MDYLEFITWIIAGFIVCYVLISLLEINKIKSLALKSKFYNKINDKNIKIFNSFKKLFEDDSKDSTNSVNQILKPLYNFILISAFILIIIFLIDLFLINFNWNNIDKYGAFGDFMGGILNPTLMFFTLLALIITIIIQRNELKLAREEYSKTANSLETQAVENTFFNTLDLHHKISENIKLDLTEISKTVFIKSNPFNFPSEKEGYVEGLKAFDSIIEEIGKNCNSPERTIFSYKKIQNEYNHIFGHYFRNLFQVLKLIDKNNTDLDNNTYPRILRAQLSSSELSLLFLNTLDGVSDNGEFRNLLIKYKMLEHLHIKKFGHDLKLSGKVIVSLKMLEQFLITKEFKNDSTKNYNGAFGKSGRVSKILNKN